MKTFIVSLCLVFLFAFQAMAAVPLTRYTGMVIAGNMGSVDLFDYTVLGDSVNLASRLEGANKQFGTGIMISRFTYEKVADRVEARMLGRIQVKGKAEEVEVYELMGILPSPPPEAA